MTVRTLTTVPDAPPARPGSRSPSAFGALLLRLHFYAGVLVAPFLVVAAVTGLLYTSTPQLDAFVYRDRAHRHRPGHDPLPLAEQIAAARAAHPGRHPGRHPARCRGQAPPRSSSPCPSWARSSTPSTSTRTRPRSRANPDHLVRIHARHHLAGRPAPQPAPGRSWAGTTRNSRRAGCGSSPWAGSCCGGAAGAASARCSRPTCPPRRACAAPGAGTPPPALWLAVGLLILSATGLTWSRYAGGNFTAVLDAFDAHSPALTTGLAPPPTAGTTAPAGAAAPRRPGRRRHRPGHRPGQPDDRPGRARRARGRPARRGR